MLTNQAFILALSACIIQLSTTALAVPAPLYGVATASDVVINLHTQVIIANLAQSYAETNVKLQSILKR